MKFYSLQIPHLANIPDEARPAVMENTRGITAVNDAGEIVGICTLDSWAPNSVMMHIWVRTPMVFRHGFQEEVFNWIFNEVGLGKALCVMRADNEKVVRLNEKMGFTELFRIKDGYDVGVDYIVSELNKEDCRWIDHGRQETRSA